MSKEAYKTVTKLDSTLFTKRTQALLRRSHLFAVLRAHVATPGAALYERLPASLALVPAVVHMYPHVLDQGLPQAVGLMAYIALEVPLTGVRGQVQSDLHHREEVLVAVRTLVRPLDQVVPLHVDAEAAAGVERLPAGLAPLRREGLFVHFGHVALLLSVVLEPLVAVRALALQLRARMHALLV